MHKYHLPYPKLPPLAPGKTGRRIFFDASRTLVIYQGDDEDIQRLIINLKGKNLVPVGETMETMP